MIGDSPARQVQSVHTAFQIVSLLQDFDGATMADLQRQLDIAKSTIHNYLQTLKSLGYVVERDGTYHLGLRFLTHGMAAKNSLEVRDVASQTLAQVSAELDQPTWWVVEEFGRGIFVDCQAPAEKDAIYGRTGKRSYLHTHAPGKAILAQVPEAYLVEILDYHGLPTYTRETTTDRDALLDELAQVRERGYAVSDGEAALGVQSVGVAFDGEYGYTHAIGVFGYSHEFTGLTQEQDVPSVLQDAAGDAERAMAQRGE